MRPVLLAFAITMSVGGAVAAASAGVATAAANPLSGQRFYVDPATPAAQQARQWRAAKRSDDANTVSRIARQPIAHWLSHDNIASEVRALTKAAAAKHRAALFVAYYVPGRDCGSFSAGGASSDAAYKRWISQVADAIGSHAATVIVEPDAITQAMTHCGSTSVRARRYALLRHAVRTLKRHRRTSVYLDAGNPGWIQPASRLAAPLRDAGIAQADGFALNVSNFYRTGTTIEYGTVLARTLGGAHFVIDTGRNGNGPLRGSQGEAVWCNPPGRALGTAPTTRTGRGLVDAFLWIKPPGSSDGPCGRGEPRAGMWWPEYALGLAR